MSGRRAMQGPRRMVGVSAAQCRIVNGIFTDTGQPSRILTIGAAAGLGLADGS